MFAVGASYISLLRAVAVRCRLPYASLLCEAVDDGSILCGVEIELPLLAFQRSPRKLFFWSCAEAGCMVAYEHAAFQAVACLQSIYGFIVVDYSFERLAYSHEQTKKIKIQDNAYTVLTILAEPLCFPGVAIDVRPDGLYRYIQGSPNVP
jgi:hypothetical protein